MQNKKDQMHPEDMRNLLIFAVASVLIWMAYEMFILGPQTKAMKDVQKARAEFIENNPEMNKPIEFITRDKALSQTKRLVFKNGEVQGSINLRGGVIDDLSLSQYFETLEKKENVKLLSPVQTERSRQVDYGWVSKNKSLQLPNAQSEWRVRGNRELSVEAPVTLVWENGQGLRFERHIDLDEHYVFKITQRVVNKSGQAVELYPYALVVQTSIPKDYQYMWITHEGPMGYLDGSLEQMNYSAMEDEPEYAVTAERGWIGFSDKYWLTALIPQQDKTHKFRFKYTQDLRDKKLSRYQTDYTGAPVMIENGQSAENTYHLYAGAKKVLMLEEYQEKLGIDYLELAVDFGWFWFFTYPFFLALHYLGLFVGNMGVAIIILTFCIRMAVYPLTSVSYRSFAKMKVVAPQITELREKYSDDKAKLQEAIVELYQREKVNPMSGCLPILIQIPIFFAFYKILLSTIEIRQAPFYGWIQDLSAPDPTSIFNLFGLLPFDPPIMIGAWSCFMLAAMLVQKKLNPPPQDDMQRMMMNIFPFFITFIWRALPRGY